MGLDEALLFGAEQTLRIYGWAPATISIGHFQPAAPFRRIADEAGIPLVRRLTGGGAILHDQEITFSLTVDAELLPADVDAAYRLIHGAAASALCACSVPVHFQTTGRHRRQQGWCFQDPAPPDLVTPSGRKILGSAQRRIRRPRPRILHHGTLVLNAPRLTPFCGEVAQYVDPAAVADELVAAFVHELGTALDLDLPPGDTTAAEIEIANRLAVEKYGSDHHTIAR